MRCRIQGEGVGPRVASHLLSGLVVTGPGAVASVHRPGQVSQVLRFLQRPHRQGEVSGLLGKVGRGLDGVSAGIQLPVDGRVEVPAAHVIVEVLGRPVSALPPTQRQVGVRGRGQVNLHLLRLTQAEAVVAGVASGPGFRIAVIGPGAGFW